MKQIKHLSMAAVMTLLLALTTPAGVIHTGIVPPPPPPADTNSMSARQSGLLPNNFEAEIRLLFLQLFSVY